MPGHDHCCTCDFCRMIAGCLGYDEPGFPLPPTAKDIEIRIYNKPACATAIDNGVAYTVPFFGVITEEFNGYCVYAYRLEVGFSIGHALYITVISRPADFTGGPCVEITVYYLIGVPGWLTWTCFAIASGSCTSDGLYMCSGRAPCSGGGDFNVNLLCRCAPFTVGGDYQTPGAELTRAVLSMCPDGTSGGESYNCVAGTCVDPTDGTGAYATLGDCEAVPCAKPPTNSYNCVAGVCTKVNDDSGTYPTLSDCIAGSCDPPPKTYDCVAGVCTDPNDGSGAYSLLADCVAAPCNPPTDCGSIESCAGTMIAEIHNLRECINGTATHTLQNLNGVYSLTYGGPLGGGVHLFEAILAPLVADYSDPGIPWSNDSSGGTHTETYIWLLQILVTCVDGAVTITEWIVYTHIFSWIDPDPPAFTGGSNENFTPPDSSLAGTIIDCTVGYMLSLFIVTDCNSATYSMNISANIG